MTQSHDPVRKRHALTLAGWALVLSLGACEAVGPDYASPEMEMPGSWHAEMVDGVTEGDAPLHQWWTLLEDPILDELVQRAAAGNRTLEEAYHGVLESRAFYTIAAGDRMPDIDAGASLQRNKISENAAGIDFGTNDSGSGGVDATWEVDVFGRVRRNIEAAEADLQVSIEDYRDLQVVLVGEVAEVYVDLRALQNRLEYAQQNVRDQRATLRLIQDRFAVGLVPGLDVAQAERNLSITESSIPRLLQGIAQDKHRLAVLLGETPAALDDLLRDHAAIPDAPDLVSVNVPADLLRQRPDVRRAERVLAAQTARVGVATAADYPIFSLSGSYRHVSNSSGDWANAQSHQWFFGPDMSWNLFDGGLVDGAIEVEDERLLAAMANYEQSVLLALEEVENALVGFRQEIDRRDALVRAVDASSRTVDLVKDLYDNGVVDFQNVIDAERELTEQQDNLADSEGTVVKNLVGLYRALGGGWDPDDPVLPPESAIDGEGDASADGSIFREDQEPAEATPTES
jgi:multidrug efflux system outer membrane protein